MATASPSKGPMGHGDRLPSGPNGLDGLPGRLAPTRDPSCFTTGSSPGATGDTLLQASRAGNFAALHGRAKP